MRLGLVALGTRRSAGVLFTFSVRLMLSVVPKKLTSGFVPALPVSDHELPGPPLVSSLAGTHALPFHLSTWLVAGFALATTRPCSAPVEVEYNEYGAAVIGWRPRSA